MSVNNWSIFDINRLLFPSQPFSWREMKAAGAAGYSQESSYALRLLPVPQMWTFLLCVPICLLQPLLALLYFLLYCFIVLFHFVTEIISRYFLAGKHFRNSHSFFKKHNFSSPFYCFSCSFSFCALSSCSPFCVRAILVLDLVTGTCQLSLCTLCVCVS